MFDVWSLKLCIGIELQLKITFMLFIKDGLHIPAVRGSPSHHKTNTTNLHDTKHMYGTEPKIIPIYMDILYDSRNKLPSLQH